MDGSLKHRELLIALGRIEIGEDAFFPEKLMLLIALGRIEMENRSVEALLRQLLLIALGRIEMRE